MQRIENLIRDALSVLPWDVKLEEVCLRFRHRGMTVEHTVSVMEVNSRNDMGASTTVGELVAEECVQSLYRAERQAQSPMATGE